MGKQVAYSFVHGLQRTSLLNISGVGQVKQERYGNTFLTIIREFCKKHGLKENAKKQSKI